MSWKAVLLQVPAYAAFVAFVGYFSSAPPYRHLAPDRAVVKLAFSHAGELKVACRARSPEELAKLAPNMRTPLKCERERAPVEIEVDLDGASVLRHVAQPSGLSRDGPSSVYHRLNVAAGEHRIRVRLKDAAGGAFGYTREATLRLAPAQVLVIDFDPEKGGITFS